MAELYGVVIEVVDHHVHDYRIDQERTRQLRAELRDRELPVGYGPGEVHPDGKRTGELLAEPARG